MISKQEAVKIHQLLIRRYGGIQGIRDLEMLESALERPHSGIENEEFYPSPEQKAAAIIESIVKNHPFHDGNKRTGYVLMRLTLMQNNLDIKTTMIDKYKFVIEIASDELEYDRILDWIKNRIVKN